MSEPHYQLVCYVGRAGTVPAPFEGWATLTQIYQQSPIVCRYAVTSDTDGDCQVWDVEDNVWLFTDPPYEPPAPTWEGGPKDLDGLVMKAMVFYGR